MHTNMSREQRNRSSRILRIAFIIAVLALAISLLIGWLLPLKETPASSWRAKLNLPIAVKNIPIIAACAEARYTFHIADCGGANCPDVYDINYPSRAEEDIITQAMTDYIQTLDVPYDFSVSREPKRLASPFQGKANTASDKEICSEFSIAFYRDLSLERLSLDE